MNALVLYIHGKGGSAAECAHYAPLFPAHRVMGLDYQTFTPWETGAEIRRAVTRLRGEYSDITLIANSIGAYFSMCAGIDGMLRRAFFISPIVDMEGLILDMMGWAGVTEEALARRGTVPTAFGETLSWDYLRYVRAHPVRWAAPTEILYGSADGLTARGTVERFAAAHRAGLTILPGGEHWFHTEAQLRFLDEWIQARMEK